MDYTIHGSTIFIKGDDLISHYLVNKNEVYKSVRWEDEEVMQHFHTIGDLPLNSEAELLNKLREERKI